MGEMSLLIRHLCILVMFVFIANCCDIDNAAPKVITSSYEKLEWPVPNGYIPVKEGQFKTYIEMRRIVDADKTNKWELYKLTMNNEPMMLMHDTDEVSGVNYKFLPYDGKYLVTVTEINIYITDLIYKVKGDPVPINISNGVGLYYFIYKQYLFATRSEIYDLDKLKDNQTDPEAARTSYDELDELKLFTSKSLKVDIMNNCFSPPFYCGQNYDKNEIVFSDEITVLFMHDVLYFMRCGEYATGTKLNSRCYFYLTHTKTEKTYYFPQNLKVSTYQLNGTRVMLFPIIDKNDTFFDAVGMDSFSSAFSLSMFNCMIATLFAMIYA